MGAAGGERRRSLWNCCASVEIVTCYLCEHLCDYNECGLCVNCRELLARNNQRVYYLSLFRDVLDEARGVLSMRTLEKIEAELQRQPPFA